MNPLLSPSADFRATRDGRRSMPFYVDVDLTNARSDSAGTALFLNIAGNSFYIDANPTDGACFVEFQDNSSDNAGVNLYCSPGVIFNLQFTQCKLVNSAQAGKKVRIVYGVDVDFQPASVAQVAISNTGGYTAVRGESWTGFTNVKGALAINTPETVLAAGSNTNGAILQLADFYDASGGAPIIGALIGHTSPPTTSQQGVLLAQVGIVSINSVSASYSGVFNPERNISIPPAYGIYWIMDVAASAACKRNTRFKVL